MRRPSREEAQEAIRTILRFIGEDPNREGLLETPERVISSYVEIFDGYEKDVSQTLKKFYDKSGFQDIVALKDIKFSSFCEHHLLPFTGTVDIAYIPNDSIVGISKLVRVVNIYAKRLQIQEKMTAQIAESIQDNLNPLGVAVKISALHSCMSVRGVMSDTSVMSTMHYTGIFAERREYRDEFLNLISKK